MRKSKKLLKAEVFDKAFDAGGNVTKHLDMKSAKVNHPIQRINLDMPKELLEKADLEAARVGVTRTALFKIWIAEHLDHLKTA